MGLGASGTSGGGGSGPVGAVELYLPGSGGRPAVLSPGFLREVEARTGRMVSRCYQCKKCTSGCPAGFTLDYQCHEIIRLVQLGAREDALRSQAIWLCASCKTCRERCPNDVDPATVMDFLKVLAVAAGVPVGRRRVRTFQKAFLSTVAAFGRAHELGSIVLYKMATPAALTDDLGLGFKMLRRGKLKLTPDRVRGRREIAAIFRRAREKAPWPAKGGDHRDG
ncbi:MAG: 4Fe-4S dicluster domain-containing protein [Bacillota bacterium]